MMPQELTDKVAEMLGVDLANYGKLMSIMDMIYDSGHHVGYVSGNDRVKEVFNQIYLTGLDAGTKAGEAKGLEQGLEQGIKEGHEKGFSEGMEAGKNEGFTSGYEAGRAAGLNEAIEVINNPTTWKTSHRNGFLGMLAIK